jgi:phosphatidylserine/phosphatidylglycerophosphate/cardiolipin synthase-like enzyme
LPEIVTRLERLKGRLKIIIDDSDQHKPPSAPESKSAARLRISAGQTNVVRQHLANIQHHKSIAVKGSGINKVLFGSTNFTWRGFYVQSNNAAVVNSQQAVDDYFEAFDNYFTATAAKDFKATTSSDGWHRLGLDGISAQVGYSPHTEDNGLLQEVGESIAKAKSCVLFSLAFLGQTTKGPIGPALGKQIQSKKVFTLGIADARVKAGNLGVTVVTPDNKRHVVRSSALTAGAPAPFANEPSGLAGDKGNERGTRMHHKFVVIDFDTPNARVYFGSYNFSEPADQDNGENLVFVQDRTIATSYMIEAIRLYDHYRFRTVQEDSKSKGLKVLTLRVPPTQPSQQPWWQRYWEDPILMQDRELFS